MVLPLRGDPRLFHRKSSRSLASIPIESITDKTLALLPSINSEAYAHRARECCYDVSNIIKSYNKIKHSNLRLFDGKISESLTFYDDNTCVISTYLENQNGNFAPSIVIHKNSTDYGEKLNLFNELWKNSTLFVD